MTYRLRLTRDRLGPGQAAALPPINRVLYLLDGELAVDAGGRRARLADNAAWHGGASCSAVAGTAGAALLRYELAQPTNVPATVPGVVSTLLLDHAIELDPAGRYLMRCDRVDFDPAGEALPHRHKGGGIRCLIAGTLALRVEGEPPRTIKPGEAWFESGREPVYARAAADTATSFIRCSILPHEIRGQSSIVYVDPAHASSKPRRYTVFVDEPIELD